MFYQLFEPLNNWSEENWHVTFELILFLSVPVIKEGTSEDVDLERLAQKIPAHWKKLGRRLLENGEAVLDAIDKDNQESCEKAYKMLLRWKRANGSGATYRVLHDALCHDLVNRQDLAEEFCLEGHGYWTSPSTVDYNIF